MSNHNEPNHNEKDEITGVETTGHEWDGIKELNNPLPRWWLWCFYGTIVFAIGYTIAYPAWPLLKTSTEGVLGWSSRGDVVKEIAALKEDRKALATQLVSTELAEVSKKPELLKFAVAGGSSAFKVYCTQCHGSGAAGGGIYPNLVDDDWIWGGDVENIYTTLNHGIRDNAHEDTRISEMPAFGDDWLEKGQIKDVAWYVLSLSGKGGNGEAAKRGEAVYAENCSSCHGDSGEGNRDLGAPAFNDAIWLYGSSHKELVAQISAPKQGTMPGWKSRLSETTIRQLALYVHSLGGGE
ncbi:MAG: cytochrome-c oxidase, cbb3-type subunit III [Pseudomonadota bacterium]